jgi:hypothetical protein
MGRWWPRRRQTSGRRGALRCGRDAASRPCYGSSPTRTQPCRRQDGVKPPAGGLLYALGKESDARQRAEVHHLRRCPHGYWWRLRSAEGKTLESSGRRHLHKAECEREVYSLKGRRRWAGSWACGPLAGRQDGCPESTPCDDLGDRRRVGSGRRPQGPRCSIYNTL